MSDERLRELERRWKESGAEDDRLAYRVEICRTGQCCGHAEEGLMLNSAEATLLIQMIDYGNFNRAALEILHGLREKIKHMADNADRDAKSVLEVITRQADNAQGDEFWHEFPERVWKLWTEEVWQHSIGVATNYTIASHRDGDAEDTIRIQCEYIPPPSPPTFPW